MFDKEFFQNLAQQMSQQARANDPEPEPEPDDDGINIEELVAKIPEMETQMEQLRKMKGIPHIDNVLKMLEGQLAMLKTVAAAQAGGPGAAAAKQEPSGFKWIDNIHVEFGSYPQGANGEVKKIVWRVLENNNGELLLVSKQVLDCKKWHDTMNTNYPKTGKQADILAAITSWEHCDLRKWLNGYFWDSAFNSQEKAQIIERLNTGNGAYIHGDYKPVKGGKANIGAIHDDTYASYDERTCRDTRDKVFLLNVKECLDYFKKETYIIPGTVWPANLDRDCTATEYVCARAQGLNPFTGETWAKESGKNNKKIKVGAEHMGSVQWWLRNIGCNDATMGGSALHMSQTAIVYLGAVFTGGTSYHGLGVGVRPAILVNIENNE